MGFFDRLSNGWAVAMQSWRVLRQDKELMLFPILSGFAGLMLLASFALPIFLIPGLWPAIERLTDRNLSGNALPRFLAFVIMFAYYVVSYFIIVYFNTALAGCAIYRFKGGDPTVSLGLKIANQRLPQIFAWSVLAATVGMILRLIEEKSEWVGKLVAGILGGLWTLATYFVVPTLAVEGLGPIDALKRSTKLISDSWGEGLAGNFSLGLIGFLLCLPAFALFALAIAVGKPWLLIAVAVIAVLYLIGVAIVTTTVQQVFFAGLYVYATERRVPQGFESGLMQSAFARK